MTQVFFSRIREAFVREDGASVSQSPWEAGIELESPPPADTASLVALAWPTLHQFLSAPLPPPLVLPSEHPDRLCTEWDGARLFPRHQ